MISERIVNYRMGFYYSYEQIGEGIRGFAQASTFQQIAGPGDLISESVQRQLRFRKKDRDGRRRREIRRAENAEY